MHSSCGMNHHRKIHGNHTHSLGFLVLRLRVLKASQANSSWDFLGEVCPLRLVCVTSPLSRDDDWL